MDKIVQLVRKWVLPDKSIVFFCVALLMMVWGGTLWQINQEHRATIATVIQENDKFTLAFEEHVRRILKTNEQYLVMLKNEYEQSQTVTPALRRMLTQIAADPLVNVVTIVDPQGTSLIGSLPNLSGLNFADLPHFQAHVNTDTGKLFIGRPLIGRVSNKETIQMSRRINDPDGNFGEIAVISISPQYFAQFYHDMHFNEQYVVRLTGLDGIVRASNNDYEMNADMRKSDVWRLLESSPDGFYYTTGSTFGKPRLMSYRAMPDYPLVVQVGVSESTLAPMLQRRLIYLGVAAAFSLFIFFYTSKLISRSRKQRQAEYRLQDSYEQLTVTHEELALAEEELRTQNGELQKTVERLIVREEELQKKEQLLVESRERYQAIIKQSSEAIVLYELGTKRIVEVNEAAVGMFGYSADEWLTMTPRDYALVSDDKAAELLHMLKTKGGFPSEIAQYRHKNGYMLHAERTGSLIEYQGRQLTVFTYHDITAERKLQEKIQLEVSLAGSVQKAMLPEDFEDDKVTILSINEPYHLVSGDYFGCKWSDDGQLLNGFILDVTGHGLATALQTAAVSTILSEEMGKNRPWTTRAVEKLNTKLAAYLPDGAFAAAMLFSLDLRRRQLTCISAGINYLLLSNKNNNGWVCLPGGFLGIPPLTNFGVATFSLQHGDAIYFLTDGFYAGMTPAAPMPVHDFDETVGALAECAVREERSDDCTALAIRLKCFSPQPLYFEYSKPGDRALLRPRVLKGLIDTVGARSFTIEVAFGEALSNALREGLRVRVKFNKLGNRLIIRIHNDGPGFPGNEAVSKIKAAGVQQTFLDRLAEEHGRGIPIMLKMMDRVIYNRRGNEIMLVKKWQVQKEAEYGSDE
ncbi:MAG: SpoIIE family protein phosphatase [Negativicutes bacterium]|nr:SpoIIE family protein phosphatase [Negativicutes bacterium]